MNRLKVWLFVLLMGAASVAAVRLVAEAERGAATRALDARLDAAGARFAAAARTLSSEASAIAALAARDAKLSELLHGKEAAPPAPRGRKPTPAPAADPAAEETAWAAASRAAVAAAERAAGFKLADGTQIVTGNHEWLARKTRDAGAADKDLVDTLGAAIGGERRLAWLRWSERLWYGAAVPVGEGAGLVLLVPVDAEWLRSATIGSGAELTLVAPGLKPLTSGSGEAPASIAEAAGRRGAGVGARDAGRFAPAVVNVLGVRVAKPSLLFLARAPAYRVAPVPVPGLAGATAVASVPAAGALAPALEVQWTLLAGTLVLVVIGFLFGLLVRPAEIAPPVPPELLTAADRIGRGDFTAHAPALAGKLGTVSAALNRAVDAAAAASRSGAPAASLTQEFFTGGERAPAATPPRAAEAAPPAFDFAPRPAAGARAPSDAEPLFSARSDGPALGGGAFEAAPVPARPAPAVIAPPPPAPVASVASAPELLQAAARAAPPAEAGGEEQHWREVFQDFLRIRSECGEPSEGLTFERFRAKLESNRANLVAKYSCRTVRFQVYVKEGKAALKATPVR